jgi:ABC-type dipeptide/oligopeptide/nickel transport system permease component
MLTMFLPSTGMIARFMRTSSLQVVNQDFVRTARAKGLRERIVFFRHVLRAALIPVLGMSFNDLARLLGGILIVEVVFSWPGIGKYIFDALIHRDLPALEASIIFLSLCVSIVYLLADILYMLLDPRIRLEKR